MDLPINSEGRLYCVRKINKSCSPPCRLLIHAPRAITTVHDPSSAEIAAVRSISLHGHNWRQTFISGETYHQTERPRKVWTEKSKKEGSISMYPSTQSSPPSLSFLGTSGQVLADEKRRPLSVKINTTGTTSGFR